MRIQNEPLPRFIDFQQAYINSDCFKFFEYKAIIDKALPINSKERVLYLEQLGIHDNANKIDFNLLDIMNGTEELRFLMESLFNYYPENPAKIQKGFAVITKIALKTHSMITHAILLNYLRVPYISFVNFSEKNQWLSLYPSIATQSFDALAIQHCCNILENNSGLAYFWYQLGIRFCVTENFNLRKNQFLYKYINGLTSDGSQLQESKKINEPNELAAYCFAYAIVINTQHQASLAGLLSVYTQNMSMKLPDTFFIVLYQEQYDPLQIQLFLIDKINQITTSPAIRMDLDNYKTQIVLQAKRKAENLNSSRPLKKQKSEVASPQEDNFSIKALLETHRNQPLPVMNPPLMPNLYVEPNPNSNSLDMSIPFYKGYGLIMAVMNEDIATVKIYLASHANIEHQNSYALRWAIQYASVDMCCLLLDHPRTILPKDYMYFESAAPFLESYGKFDHLIGDAIAEEKFNHRIQQLFIFAAEFGHTALLESIQHFYSDKLLYSHVIMAIVIALTNNHEEIAQSLFQKIEPRKLSFKKELITAAYTAAINYGKLTMLEKLLALDKSFLSLLFTIKPNFPGSCFIKTRINAKEEPENATYYENFFRNPNTVGIKLQFDGRSAATNKKWTVSQNSIIDGKFSTVVMHNAPYRKLAFKDGDFLKQQYLDSLPITDHHLSEIIDVIMQSPFYTEDAYYLLFKAFSIPKKMHLEKYKNAHFSHNQYQFLIGFPEGELTTAFKKLVYSLKNRFIGDDIAYALLIDKAYSRDDNEMFLFFRDVYGVRLPYFEQALADKKFNICAEYIQASFLENPLLQLLKNPLNPRSVEVIQFFNTFPHTDMFTQFLKDYWPTSAKEKDVSALIEVLLSLEWHYKPIDIEIIISELIKKGDRNAAVALKKILTNQKFCTQIEPGVWLEMISCMESDCNQYFTNLILQFNNYLLKAISSEKNALIPKLGIFQVMDEHKELKIYEKICGFMQQIHTPLILIIPSLEDLSKYVKHNILLCLQSSNLVNQFWIIRYKDGNEFHNCTLKLPIDTCMSPHKNKSNLFAVDKLCQNPLVIQQIYKAIEEHKIQRAERPPMDIQHWQL